MSASAKIETLGAIIQSLTVSVARFGRSGSGARRANALAWHFPCSCKIRDAVGCLQREIFQHVPGVSVDGLIPTCAVWKWACRYFHYSCEGPRSVAQDG